MTRYEHSLGVYLLLGRLGAVAKERIAGLLHDISHTAFSHAVDFVFSSEQQDHHEGLKPDFLHRDDLVGPLAALGYVPEDFYDDSIYPLLEQPLPRLCADRLDYFFRDSLACGATTADQVRRFLDHLTVVDGASIAFTDAAVAREAAERFALMNRDWWASPTEAFIYNEFADALRAALESGFLDDAALLGDDESVLRTLQSCGDPCVLAKLVASHRLPRRIDRRFLAQGQPEDALDRPARGRSSARRRAVLTPAGPIDRLMPRAVRGRSWTLTDRRGRTTIRPRGLSGGRPSVLEGMALCSPVIERSPHAGRPEESTGRSRGPPGRGPDAAAPSLTRKFHRAMPIPPTTTRPAPRLRASRSTTLRRRPTGPEPAVAAAVSFPPTPGFDR